MSSAPCVLCHVVGHIGSNCPEKVCILCFSPGHLYSECGSFSKNIKTEPEDDATETRADNVEDNMDVSKCNIKREPITMQEENVAYSNIDFEVNSHPDVKQEITSKNETNQHETETELK